MLWTIFVVLLILWLLGFSRALRRSLIHSAACRGVGVLMINLSSGRRTVV